MNAIAPQGSCCFQRLLSIKQRISPESIYLNICVFDLLKVKFTKFTFSPEGQLSLSLPPLPRKGKISINTNPLDTK